ncbi:hypothetical protein OPV22_012342 [Ensete ventricosum]|uniref:Uncharacterized protein n=1 Tax=Ensete ventricosum TaxID=4639 RepID=A0AAV8R7C6_ENSVE|nr:hypothetical protein OPV22_012342 [Ensete ventricosum]
MLVGRIMFIDRAEFHVLTIWASESAPGGGCYVQRVIHWKKTTRGLLKGRPCLWWRLPCPLSPSCMV